MQIKNDHGQNEHEPEREHDSAADPHPEKPTDEPGPDQATEEASAVVESPGDAGTGSRTRSGRPGRAIAWLALLLALAALVLAAHPYWPERFRPAVDDFSLLQERIVSLEQTLAEARREARSARQDLAARIDGLEQRLASTAGRIDTRQPDTSGIENRLDAVDRKIGELEGERNSALAALRARVSDVESRVGGQLEQFRGRLDEMGTNLDQADRELAARLRLIEADSLLAIAGDRLMLNDIDAARRAWSRALDRLGRLQGARFEPLRETAHAEFERLQGYRPASVVDDVRRLQRLAGAVSDWPARGSDAASPGSGTQQAGATGEAGWRQRLGNVFDDLVRVERVDPEALDPLEIELARTRVQALLHSASLALARSDTALAASLVDEAVAGIERAFATDAAAVRDALGWLRGFEPETPAEPPELDRTRAEIARLLGGDR
ncbi:MAG: uroporphyrinogen-III C-methyltransferase [Wenzhouxiangellaceae bacterium]|nr:uroporphyrinogen-III C-methyltransferase [Wenzhouxiangellaceae bacterium]